ncbi:hypothetical protein DTO013E5_3632 [Penicillium roqueforti]|uniref:Genomic scaffold, ProqFM164S02 n=1 Tax=Penicillium roqueforti (strain FM164) TaxID=1365484 RepID=W6Q621_PENRF|nr:uncharacterized protein LCP9604111_415 [Penicillium roqueforti]CDM32153.1 unnamed protein product [Penicillium roqueforti FM164]KAF9252889.1 hypothetical protein LCP9604111_415 [Penicillium roqueforti]KAI2697858.1 hypothetical protein CBS147372_7430 [Penicillium roqueforti]KAI2721155.1 hypothetical protein CBS147354_5837 [Penicillium roqueforti]KAI2724099.1 hypothetical protein CBS147318_1030 [Penicillium roqueforti]
MNSTPSLSESASVNPIDQASEVDYNKHYHHPVWPQRWHHPDFTEKAMAKWKEEPCYRNTADRITHRFLTQRFPCHFPWGYIIYRTVYTPESEKLWPIAMEKLTRVMTTWIKGELNYGDDPRPEHLIEESHKDVIISDSSRWDGAGIEQVRGHFAQYLREIKQEEHCEESRFAVRLVIDERSLNSLVATDDPDDGFVGVVDGRYDPGKRYDSPSDCGYMRVLVWALWPLYLNLQFDHMCELCPNAPDGWIPVYDEGDGTAQDEDGNFIPREFFRKRPEGLTQRRRGRG